MIKIVKFDFGLSWFKMQMSRNVPAVTWVDEWTRAEIGWSKSLCLCVLWLLLMYYYSVFLCLLELLVSCCLIQILILFFYPDGGRDSILFHHSFGSFKHPTSLAPLMVSNVVQPFFMPPLGPSYCHGSHTKFAFGLNVW